jgi:hypothetical protein
MGGLLTRYYLRYGDTPLPADGTVPEPTWTGASNIEPAVVGTMPAVYQLLPRDRHGPLVAADDGDRRVGSLYDPDLWVRLGWGLADEDQDPVLQMLLPDVPVRAERRRIALDHLHKALARARQFARALDQPGTPPAHLKLKLVAGDAIPTDAVAAVDESTGELEVVQQAPGDGTVLRTSALLDERVGGEWQPRVVTPIRWADVSFLFRDHLGMTKDPYFADNVLFFLLEGHHASGVAGLEAADR